MFEKIMSAELNFPPFMSEVSDLCGVGSGGVEFMVKSVALIVLYIVIFSYIKLWMYLFF